MLGAVNLYGLYEMDKREWGDIPSSLVDHLRLRGFDSFVQIITGLKRF